MAIKELQTRIALKYDSYANWSKTDVADKYGNLVLLSGEIGICEIPVTNADSNVAPTVLFKVGGAKYPEGHDKAGQLMAFKDLPWASAKAADVYGWAKKTEAEFTTWLSETAAFATDAEVDAIREALAARIAELEGQFTGNDSVDAKIAKAKSEAIAAAATDATTKANTAEGNAKAYTDTAIGTASVPAVGAEGDENYVPAKAATGIRAVIEQAEADAKAYTDSEIEAIVETIEASDAAQDEEINKKLDKVTFNNFNNGVSTNVAAIETDIVTKANTAEANAIAAAKTETQTQINTLVTSGQVATNTGAIARIEEAYIEADTNLGNRITALSDAIGNLSNVMNFRGAVASFADITDPVVGDVITFKSELKEDGTVIATAGSEWVYAETKPATDNTDAEYNWIEIGTASASDAAIAGLQSRMTTAEGHIETLSANVATKLESGDFASWKQSHEADHANKQTAISAEIDADVAAEAALREAADDAITDIIGTGFDKTTGNTIAEKVSKAQSTANDAAGEAARANGRLDVEEPKIKTLQDIVSGYTTAGSIKKDIDDLKSVVVTGDDANTKLRADITGLQNIVVNGDNSNEKLAAKVAAIEGDYLKASDFANDYYIFNCGSSSTVVHTN